MVSGKEDPLSANSGLLTEAEETVTLDPLALKVTVILLFVPTVTLPKLTLVGVTLICPVAIPVPDKEIVGAAAEELETKAMLPLALPADCGANST
jgi:hypothetical protein